MPDILIPNMIIFLFKGELHSSECLLDGTISDIFEPFESDYQLNPYQLLLVHYNDKEKCSYELSRYSLKNIDFSDMTVEDMITDDDLVIDFLLSIKYFISEYLKDNNIILNPTTNTIN